MVRLLCTLLLLLVFPLVMKSEAFCAEPGDPFPGVASSYLVMIDGKAVWGHRVDARRPPASITKIMTALVVIERGGREEVATVSPAAARETGTRLGLRAGERLKVSDLLAAVLIQSANDACHVLADHVAGNEEGFVRLMNKKAAELGLKGTRFSNACGHDDPGLYSTAADLARLARYAMANGVFADLVATVRKEIRTVDGRRSFQLENKNELLGRYDGIIGVKSGTTPNAGKSVLALAERDGRKVMLVLLDAPDRWWSAAAILDKAFALSGSGSLNKK